MKATVIVALSFAILAGIGSMGKGVSKNCRVTLIGGILRTALFVVALVFVCVGM